MSRVQLLLNLVVFSLLCIVASCGQGPRFLVFDANSKQGSTSLSSMGSVNSIQEGLSRVSPRAPAPSIEALEMLAASGGSPTREAITGTDDRKEYYESDDLWKARMRSSFVIVPKSALIDEGANFRYSVRSLQQAFNICADEKFAQQPYLAQCSGVLIGTNLFATAQHCLTSFSTVDDFCSKAYIVSDFYLTSSGAVNPLIPKQNVYTCARVIKQLRSSSPLRDSALLQLSQPVCDRSPLKVEFGARQVGEEVGAIGSAKGSPMKSSASGKVTGYGDDSMGASYDFQGGYSGGPVISKKSGAVIGLTKGEFIDSLTQSGSCNRWTKCPENDPSQDCVALAVALNPMKSDIESHVAPSCDTSKVSTLNAASYADGALAPGSLATVFGRGFYNNDPSKQYIINSKPLPRNVSGLYVKINNSVEAELLFTSDTQINLVLPENLPTGTLRLDVYNNGRVVGTGTINVYRTAPGLFTRGFVGAGGDVIGQEYSTEDGKQTIRSLEDESHKSIKVKKSTPGNPTVLVLYGTGLTDAVTSSLKVKIGGIDASVLYVGIVGGDRVNPPYQGLDQINVSIPEGVGSGAQAVEVTDTSTGQSAAKVFVQME